jgi:multidrug efflux pump subunit AcrA (membrane-fusion protein)
LALARKNLSYAVIPAPIDGFVTERTADLGEYVSPQQKVVTIVKTNPLRIRIDIPEQAIPEVKLGQSVSITTSAWPRQEFCRTRGAHRAECFGDVADVDCRSSDRERKQCAKARTVCDRAHPARAR